MSPAPDASDSAREAGLRYVNDAIPGIRRKRSGKGFSYRDERGQLIRDQHALRRFKSLVIPPAWTDVWICSLGECHIQATGRDARGRKQYRYHPDWRKVRDETKFDRIIGFARALPEIRSRVDEDLALPGLPRRKVLATVVRLLETTLIRVGNEEYARANRSFGLTTMRDQHVDIAGATLKFEFQGKSGKRHNIRVTDRRLATIVKRCRDLPGYELFQYIDEAGTRQSIDSSDVNGYLKDLSGEEYTAKDFRTWAGTVLAALALQEFKSFDSHAEAKKNILRAIEAVAERLGNTPTICRKCYIHPLVIETYMEGSLLDTLQQRTQQELTESLAGLKPEEAAVVALLQQRLSRESRQSKAG